MKRLLFVIAVLIVVMLSVSVTPTYAAAPDQGTIQAIDPAPSLNVSWVSWITLHVVAFLGVVTAALTAGVSIWANALAQVKRQEERLAVAENLAKSLPPQAIDVIKLLIMQIAKVGTLAAETSELATKLTDDKVDFDLNPKKPTDPPPPPNDDTLAALANG